MRHTLATTRTDAIRPTVRFIILNMLTYGSTLSEAFRDNDEIAAISREKNQQNVNAGKAALVEGHLSLHSYVNFEIDIMNKTCLALE